MFRQLREQITMPLRWAATRRRTASSSSKRGGCVGGSAADGANRLENGDSYRRSFSRDKQGQQSRVGQSPAGLHRGRACAFRLSDLR